MGGHGGEKLRVSRVFRGTVRNKNQSSPTQWGTTTSDREKGDAIASRFLIIAVGLNRCKALLISHGFRAKKMKILLSNRLICCISLTTEIMSRVDGIIGDGAPVDLAINAVEMKVEGGAESEATLNSGTEDLAGMPRTEKTTKPHKPSSSKHAKAPAKAPTTRASSKASKAHTSKERHHKGTANGCEQRLNTAESTVRIETAAVSPPATPSIPTVRKVRTEMNKRPADQANDEETANRAATEMYSEFEAPANAPLAPLTAAQNRRRQRQQAKAAGNKPAARRAAAAKRERGGERHESENVPKRPKHKFSEIVARNLRMAIVNKTDRVEWRVSEETAEEIQEKLRKLLMDKSIAGGPPRYSSSGLIRGHFLVNCHDLPARYWLEEAVKRIRIDDGHVVLDCVEEDSLPERVTIRIYSEVETESELRNILNYQNGTLQVPNWKFIEKYPRRIPVARDPRSFAPNVYKYVVCGAVADQIEKDGGVWHYFKRIPVVMSRKGDKDHEADENSAGQSASQ